MTILRRLWNIILSMLLVMAASSSIVVSDELGDADDMSLFTAEKEDKAKEEEAVAPEAEEPAAPAEAPATSPEVKKHPSLYCCKQHSGQKKGACQRKNRCRKCSKYYCLRCQDPKCPHRARPVIKQASPVRAK